MKRSLFFLFYVAVFFIGGLSFARFLQQNMVPAQLYFGADFLGYWRTREMTLGWLVCISFILGFGLASSVVVSSLISKVLEIRRLRRELTALQKIMEIRDRGTPAVKDLPL